MAREAIDRVSSRLFFTQITIAVRLVQEVRSFCRAADWHRAIDRCEQLRIVLAGVVDDPKLQGDDQKSVTRAIDDLLLIIRHLERDRSGQKVTNGSGKNDRDFGQNCYIIDSNRRAASNGCSGGVENGQ